MPRRGLLSAEQRARLSAVPDVPEAMARHYVLSLEDLALIRAKRRAGNRLGFAVQLCLLRFLGRILAPDEVPPAPKVAFVANQLAIAPALFSDYGQRDETRREHVGELQRHLRLRSFRLADWRACLQAGTHAAWTTDRGEPIVVAILAHLRAMAVMIPAGAVLERIGIAARVRARKHVFEALGEGLPVADRQALEAPLRLDPEIRRSRFAWLRDCPESPAPSNMLALLDRLDFVRSLGNHAMRGNRIHPARLGRLIEEGSIMTAQHIADLEPARRTAILVAQAAHLDTRIADATLAMFDQYVGSLFTKARNREERRFQATRRDVARALLLFRRTIAALQQARETGEDDVVAVDREVGMKRLDQALPIIQSATDAADQDILVTAAERYAVLRRFSPRFLEPFRFQSNTQHDPVLTAVELVKAMNRDGKSSFPKRPPAAFMPAKWRRLIFAGGQADRRLYETAVLAILRERLRGSDIWVADSRDWRAFEDHLRPAEAPIPTSLSGETDPSRYVAARAAALQERLMFVGACAGRGELDGVEIEEGRLYIARIKPAVPDAVRPLADRLYGLLPQRERNVGAALNHYVIHATGEFSPEGPLVG